MCREDHGSVVGALVEFFDEDRPFVFEFIDHVFVMHDFVAHVDGGPPFIERHFDDLDRPVHACAKAARGGEVEGEGGLGHGCLRLLGTELSPCGAGVQSQRCDQKERLRRAPCFVVAVWEDRCVCAAKRAAAQ